jgi:hypothetical protein
MERNLILVAIYLTNFVMTPSTDSKVQQFLEDLAQFQSVNFAIINKIRSIVLTSYPEISERMMYGGIMFTLEKDFGGVFAYKDHVSLEFSQGSQFNDPNKLLQGSGKFRRHLKFSSSEDVDDKMVLFFVDQAVN